MSALPVNAILSGIQPDGHWTGTPSLIVGLVSHPDATPLPDTVNSLPVPEWKYDAANEVTINRLMTRNGRASPHFANIGPSTLFIWAKSYRERHIVLAGHEAGRHDLAPFIQRMVEASRTVQVITTDLRGCVGLGAWVTLLALPSQSFALDVYDTPPDEVVADIRWRADLDRVAALYSNLPVWLRASPVSDTNVYAQCVAAATKRPAWRVMGK